MPTILANKIENSEAETKNKYKTNKEFEETTIEGVYHIRRIITH